MTKRKKMGGKRPGAGRKPVADKKMALRVFVPTSWVALIGAERAKAACVATLENEYNWQVDQRNVALKNGNG